MKLHAVHATLTQMAWEQTWAYEGPFPIPYLELLTMHVAAMETILRTPTLCEELWRRATVASYGSANQPN
jgi:hypothetical protein